jgi:hypothetical protein
MTTTTGYRGVDPRVIIELQDTPDPDTGKFRTADVIRGILEREHQVKMTTAAVRQKAMRYRKDNGLPPPPITGERTLPWELPDAAHRDVNGYALHRIARRFLAESRGEQATFHPEEQRAVAAFERFLAGQGPATVVAWDPEASRGAGGWVIRQAVDGEEIRYGVMAVRPYPTD